LKLADFDFSVDLKRRKNKKLSTQVGTPGFMAPEIVNGERFIGPFADIFSAGVVLFNMATSKIPFEEA